MGGPVYIPKVYDGRNKTFFLANYEGWRIINGARVSETVPNPALLTGDFSQETYPAGVGGLPRRSVACLWHIRLRDPYPDSATTACR